MSKETNSIFGLLVGTAIGATLGILFAPDKGSNTRHKVKHGIDTLEETVSDKTNALKNQIQDLLPQSEADFENQLNALVSNMDHKMDELIQILDKKLKDLKNLNKKTS